MSNSVVVTDIDTHDRLRISINRIEILLNRGQCLLYGEEEKIENENEINGGDEIKIQRREGVKAIREGKSLVLHDTRGGNSFHIRAPNTGRLPSPNNNNNNYYYYNKSKRPRQAASAGTVPLDYPKNHLNSNSNYNYNSKPMAMAAVMLRLRPLPKGMHEIRTEKEEFENISIDALRRRIRAELEEYRRRGSAAPTTKIIKTKKITTNKITTTTTPQGPRKTLVEKRASCQRTERGGI